MRLHRFIGKFDLTNKNLLITDKEIINQISRVLRFQPGDEIILGDGSLNEAVFLIERIGKGGIEGQIIGRHKNKNELPIYGILYCSVLKKENFEFVVQKATELGIKEVVPVISNRTVKLNFNRERLEKIIREAAEQSGRGMLPKISEPVKFEKAVEIAAKENDLNLFFDLKGESLRNNFHISPSLVHIGLFVGPEGGWDESEYELAKKSKFKPISLGTLTLRAETAAIAAIATALNTH